MQQNRHQKQTRASYNQLNFDKDAKKILWRKDGFLSKWHWGNWESLRENKKE